MKGLILFLALAAIFFTTHVQAGIFSNRSGGCHGTCGQSAVGEIRVPVVVEVSPAVVAPPVGACAPPAACSPVGEADESSHPRLDNLFPNRLHRRHLFR